MDNLKTDILNKKAKKIEFLLLDVDGILTDGKIFIDSYGNELKTFHIHDGHGIYLIKKAGIDVGIISGRSSRSVEHRAKELNITEVYQGITDKVSAYKQIKEKYNLSDECVAFMGDDLIDLPLLSLVGFSATAADAVSEVKEAVDMITEKPGGGGAVRELIDFILKAKG
ncbi:MAG: HAD-IIIA family hydrolase [Nitrospirota bacterium]